MKYAITTTDGFMIGYYDGENPQEARDACARDAGYASEADMEARLDAPSDLVAIGGGMYDHIEPGDLVMVWDDRYTHACLRRFAGVHPNGLPLAYLSNPASVYPWVYCLTIDEYAAKYL